MHPENISPVATPVSQNNSCLVPYFISKIDKNNPSKITIQLDKEGARKRKMTNDQESGQEGSSKKNRIDDAELRKIVEATARSVREEVEEAIMKGQQRTEENIVKTMQDQLGPIKTSLEKLESKQYDIEEGQRKQEERINRLQERMEGGGGIVQECKDQMKKEIREEMKKDIEAAYKFSLASEVAMHNKNLIIHGLSPKDANKELIDLMEKIVPGNSFTFKVEVLGKREEGKKMTILVRFCSPFERNQVLANAKNVPKGVSLDKDIPVAYREKYKHFRRKAFRLKQATKVNTQIAFVGHLMQLRARDSADKQFTIIEEYYPEVRKAVNSIAGSNVDTSLASPNIGTLQTKLAEATKMFTLSGLEGMTPMNLDKVLTDIMSKTDRSLIEDMNMIGNVAFITCKDKDSCSKLVMRYNGRKAGSVTLNCEKVE